MPPRGVNKGSKRDRQYQHIRESQRERGVSEDRAEEIAARTVNKERARSGEARTSSRTSIEDISSGRRGVSASAWSFQHQLRPMLPGVFMRASSPRPSRSCIWIIATCAGELNASLISAMCAAASPRQASPRERMAARTRARAGASRVLHHPASVLWSCVPV